MSEESFKKLRWPQQQRLAFIRKALAEKGKLNRSMLIDEFGISKQQATNDISEITRREPNLMWYDTSAKCFRPVRMDIVSTPILRVGNLPTMNDDDYEGLGKWWIQIWNGDYVFARIYGDTPQEVRDRASLTASAFNERYKSRGLERHNASQSHEASHD